MAHSPAHVLGAYLAGLGTVVTPPVVTPWPHYVDFKPENPHQAVVLYNTYGKMDGRLMRSGQTVEHPGIMVMVRAADDPAAYAKIKEIVDILDTVQNASVTVEEVQYVIEAITRKSSIISLGQEQGNTRRVFSANHIITLRTAT